MKNELLTFNDLPQVVAQLRDEVMGMKVALLNLQNGTTKVRQYELAGAHSEEVVGRNNLSLIVLKGPKSN